MGLFRKVNRALLAPLLVAFLLLGTSGVLSYVNSSKLTAALEDVRLQQVNRDLEADLLGSLHQAESAMFGFVVTGEESFLESYHPATNDTIRLLRQLVTNPAWVEEHGDDVNSLQWRVEKRLAMMSDRISKRLEGFQAAADAITTGEAKAVMDQIRRTLEHLQRAEEQLLTYRQEKVLSRVRKTLWFDVVFGSSSLILVGVICTFLLIENARRKEHEEALRESHDLLETRVEQRTAELAKSNQLLEHNVQELERSEHALRSSQADLSQTAAELRMKNEDLEMLVYIVSHDLRSPLVNVQGFGKELQRATVVMEKEMECCQQTVNTREALGEMRESINFVMAGVHRMDALLSGFLKYSRLGRQALRPEKIRTTEMMKGLAETLEFQLKDCGARVVIEQLPDCYGDRTQISQVFSNLLDNAVKYRHPERSLKLTVTGERIEGDCIIRVSDNGLGIPPEHRARVFHIFHRVGVANVSGEGLGLTIARRLLERNQGKIWVEETSGGGSTFCVQLPLNARE